MPLACGPGVPPKDAVCVNGSIGRLPEGGDSARPMGRNAHLYQGQALEV
jgi:hypothetical protein